MSDITISNEQFIAQAMAETVGLPVRYKIESIEAAMLQLPQVEMQLDHYFADGLYGRCLHIPKNTLLTGKIHKREHINIILKGKIAVATEQGEQFIEGPAVIISPPGTKRIGLAVEDTIWMTVHAANSTTVEEAEAELVTNDRKEYEEGA